MSQNNQKTGADLNEAALAVLIETHGMDSAAKIQILEEWRARSSAHDNAMNQAEANWSLMGQMTDMPLSPSDRLILGAETVLASVNDHPKQTAAAMTLGALLIAAPFLIPASSPIEPEWIDHDYHHAEFVRYVTDRGEQQELVLSNGAKVWLNWNSEIRVQEGPESIHLDVVVGDALFSLPSEQEKPLIIHSGEVVAYAPATEFAVHSHGPQDAFFQVKEGSVTISGLDEWKPQKLGALQEAYVFEGQSRTVRPAYAEAIAAWREGKAVFKNMPLLNVLYELSHYTNQRIVVGELVNATAGVNTTIRIDSADAALVDLARMYGLELVSTSPNEVLVRSLDARRL